MARDLKRINAYPEFRTAEGIDGVRAAVLASWYASSGNAESSAVRG